MVRTSQHRMRCTDASRPQVADHQQGCSSPRIANVRGGYAYRVPKTGLVREVRTGGRPLLRGPENRRSFSEACSNSCDSARDNIDRHVTPLEPFGFVIELATSGSVSA